MRKLYTDIGACLELTEIEEKILFGNEDSGRADVLKKVISEGRIKPWHWTSITGGEIATYNANYGTHYSEGGIDIYVGER